MLVFPHPGATPPYVIISTRNAIQKVSVHDASQTTLISGLPNVIALDFAYNHNASDGDDSIVFWTDIVDDKIYKATLFYGGMSWAAPPYYSKDLGRLFWRCKTCISLKIDVLLSCFRSNKILR